MSDEHLAAAPKPLDAQRASTLQRRADALRPLLAVLAYFIAYLVLRLAEQGGLERDEAEIVYLARDLRLGYGTQPPLYTWLQWLAFQAFGLDRFALVIVKDASLFATFVTMYCAARPLAGRNGALVAAAMLLLFPQIGWEALRTQTHSVLMTTLACALLWCYVALLNRQNPARYAWFGLVAGLGMLAKYNFGMLLAGIAGASLLVPEHRRLLWNRKIWIALVLALLVFAPHAAWIVQHPDAAFAGTLHKMQDGSGDAAYFGRVGRGALEVLSSLVAYIALPLAVFAAVCWPLRKQLDIDTRAPASRFFLFLYALCFLQLALLVLTGVVGTVKERWLTPVLFSLPLAAAVMLPALRRPEAARKILRIATAVGLLMLALVPGRTWLGPAFGKAVAPHYPYKPLAEALQRRYPSARAVVTDDIMLAGNLSFVRPGLHPLMLDDALRDRRPLAGEVLLVAQEGQEQGLRRDFRAAYPGARPLGVDHLVLPMRLGGKGTLGFSAQAVQMGELDAPPTAGRARQTNAPAAPPR
jgi:hypothetical protein